MEPKSAPQVLPVLPKGFVQEFIEGLNKYEIVDPILTFIKVGTTKIH